MEVTKNVKIDIDVEVDIEFEDVIDYLEYSVPLSLRELNAISEVIDINIDFDDVCNYVDNISKSEENQLLELLSASNDFHSDNLYDEQKLDVLKVLYKNMTLEQLQNVEKNIK